MNIESDDRSAKEWYGHPFMSDAEKKGKLKIFFGYAAGVGKTYAMLDEAMELKEKGLDVLIGYLGPHTRPETLGLIESIPILPPKVVRSNGENLKEFDLDQAIARKPALIVVDELAHTNVSGVRHRKRFQDIEELLNAGIDVYTTVNVQHIESLNDIVQKITKVQVGETVPDYIFDGADMVKLIDIEPEELLKRFESDKAFHPERPESSVNSFLTKENLRLLREIAIRKAADRISRFNLNENESSEKSAGFKLLVCIGPSPNSAKCIRWTARMADAFHSPWTAAFVQDLDNQSLTEDEKKSIGANMALADELGADIVTLNGADIATVIAGYAKMSGITNIVVGKSRNKRSLKNLFKPDLEDRLISLMPNIEVHIIPGNQTGIKYARPLKKRVKESVSFSWQDTLKTILYLAAATLLSMLIRRIDISQNSIIMVYILTVLIISRTTTGFLYGISASILSVLAFNFFFTAPYLTFITIDPSYPIIFIIMLLVAIITSAMTVRIKTQALIAVERAHRTGMLFEINKKLLVTRDLNKITNLTNEYLVNLFERSAIFYTGNPLNKDGCLKQYAHEEDASFLLSEKERQAATWAFLNRKSAGTGTDTLSDAEGIYVPVVAQGKALGVIGLSCKRDELNQENRMFLQMIVSQVAMALERHKLSLEQRAMQIESAREKMRANLLRAISHDLRTPLTSISGASSALLENKMYFDETSRTKLLEDIKEESLWLIRLVENILSVTRINEGGAGIKKTPEAAEEIVAEAISRIKTRYPNCKISVRVPDEILFVPMDGTLIEQVIINLLENAVKHSGNNTQIEMVVRKEGEEAVFEVSDNGGGISDQDMPYIFESYSPERQRSADSSRGMGIGLSICVSIIKSHNGRMEAENKKEGGAVFRFTLPLEEGAKDGK